MRHGRWRSVAIARRYIRAGQRWDDNAAAGLRGELAALEVPDLRFEPEGVVVRLRRSKGDQKEKGLRRHPAWHGRAIRGPKLEHKLAERILSEA